MHLPTTNGDGQIDAGHSIREHSASGLFDADRNLGENRNGSYHASEMPLQSSSSLRRNQNSSRHSPECSDRHSWADKRRNWVDKPRSRSCKRRAARRAESHHAVRNIHSRRSFGPLRSSPRQKVRLGPRVRKSSFSFSSPLKMGGGEFRHTFSKRMHESGRCPIS